MKNSWEIESTQTVSDLHGIGPDGTEFMIMCSVDERPITPDQVRSLLERMSKKNISKGVFASLYGFQGDAYLIAGNSIKLWTIEYIVSLDPSELVLRN